MNARRLLEWGGLAAGIVLIAFGIGAIAMGVDGRATVRDSLEQEQIFFGDASDPAVAEHAQRVGGRPGRARATRHAPSRSSCASTRSGRRTA